MTTVRIFKENNLWVAYFATDFGTLEVLCGEGGAPDLRYVLLAEQFLAPDFRNLAAVRRSVFALPVLWRPIRLAVNNKGRLGLQFKNRITGRQEGMFFADEHSSFKTTCSDVTVTAEEENRLQRRA